MSPMEFLDRIDGIPAPSLSAHTQFAATPDHTEPKRISSLKAPLDIMLTRHASIIIPHYIQSRENLF